MDEFISKIKDEGYCRIPQVYEAEKTERALALAKAWQRRMADTLPDDIPFLNRNHPMVYNLEAKDHYFLELLFQSDIVHKILMHFLNDRWHRRIPQNEPNYILRSYLARSSNAALPLHIDSFIPYMSPESFIMQVSIILEDQNEQNGCTIVVPGSHLFGEYADRDRTEEAIPLYSRAGDVVIWDSRLWHGTKANNTSGSRWALIATFCRWWIKQAFNMVGNVPQHIYDKLTDNQKAILGYCSIPFEDETQGIDMKQGYDMLLPSVNAYRQRRSLRSV